MTATLRERLGIIAMITVLVLTGGVATASWLASGTGSGAAQATSAQNLVVSAAVPSATLYPKPSGGYGSSEIGTIVATVDNPNVFPVDLTTATLGAITITPLSGRVCPVGSILPAGGVTTITLSPTVRVAGASSGTTVAVPGTLEMIASAEDGCQGASVSVALTVSGTLA